MRHFAALSAAPNGLKTLATLFRPTLSHISTLMCRSPGQISMPAPVHRSPSLCSLLPSRSITRPTTRDRCGRCKMTVAGRNTCLLKVFRLASTKMPSRLSHRLAPDPTTLPFWHTLASLQPISATAVDRSRLFTTTTRSMVSWRRLLDRTRHVDSSFADSHTWQARYGDPGFHKHVAASEVGSEVHRCGRFR